MSIHSERGWNVSFESTIIQGNLGSEPEMKYMPDGKAVCNFSVAVTRRRGEGKATVWYRVAAWGEMAENCHKYLHKGSGVLVSGRVDARAYIDKAGAAAASLDLTAFSVTFTDKAGQREGDYPPPPDNAGDIPF